MLLHSLILVALLLGPSMSAQAGWSARDRLTHLGRCLKVCDKEYRRDGRAAHCTGLCRCLATKDEATGMSLGEIEQPTPAAQRTLDVIHRPCMARMRHAR